MEQLIAYLSGVMTPITLLFIYALLVAGKDGRDE